MIASLYVRYTGFTNSLDSGPLRSDTANTLLGKLFSLILVHHRPAAKGV